MGKNLKGKELGEGLSQRKDGRYSARFKSKSGKRIEKYFSKLPEAKVWLNQARYEDGHNNTIADSEITFDEWFNIWLNHEKNFCRKNTISLYDRIYRVHIQQYIGSMKLCDVRPLHCQNVINILKENNLKISTIEKTRQVMKTSFRYAIDNELILKNPVKVQIPKKEKTERRVLTETEQKMFLELAKQKTVYYSTFAFVLQTGLRCGEVTGLKWSDIDMEKRLIYVKRSVSYDEEKKTFIDGDTKTLAGKRIVPMTTESYKILMDLKSERAKKSIADEYKDYIFLNSRGKLIHRAGYNRALYRIAGIMGVEQFSMHTLRHTFATRCIESGMRPKTLQKLLGHSSLNMTMDLYVHVTEDASIEEMKKFEMMFNGVKMA